MIELLNIDCMSYMATLPDKAFDLAIVDPPYGINAPNMQRGNISFRVRDGRSSTAVDMQKEFVKGRLNTGSGKLKNRILNSSNIGWDNDIPTNEYFIELFRISKNQIVWGGNYFDLGPTRCIVCWNKLQPWENFSQWEMAWTSFDKPASMFTYSNTGGANQETKIHPTQKPVKLYKFLLSRYANSDDKILDTHGGSMSSAIACYQMGFDLVLTEIDKDYYDAGVKRFNEAIKQQSLFDYNL